MRDRIRGDRKILQDGGKKMSCVRMKRFYLVLQIKKMLVSAAAKKILIIAIGNKSQKRCDSGISKQARGS